MLMNKTEFWLMNNPVRRFVQKFEARKLRKMSPSQSPEKVLEIGCGEGEGAKNILHYWSPQSLTSIDLDPRMIARAKRRVKDGRVTFQDGDAAHLEFADNNTYDAIFDFGILHHIPNWEECLTELYRVLKPGGYLHIEDGSIESFTETMFGRFLKGKLDHPYDEMYSKSELEVKLSELGFKTVNDAELKRLRFFWKILQK